MHTLFKVRQILMGGALTEQLAAAGPGLVAHVKAIGWGVLAENPGRSIVFGAVTQPWVAAPVFRAQPRRSSPRSRSPDT